MNVCRSIFRRVYLMPFFNRTGRVAPFRLSSFISFFSLFPGGGSNALGLYLQPNGWFRHFSAG